MASLPRLAGLPREELEWLADHGEVEAHEAGDVVAPRGRRIETLWVLLKGHIVVRVDHGAGPRRVIEWKTGEVSGMLPYSRMKGPPGDNVFEEPSELLTIHERHFPEMIRACPVFTALTVHLMLDRARSFNTSALQDEKMVSLGKLAAGLAHELNNPAASAVRAAKQMAEGLQEVEAASRALGAARLSEEALDRIGRVRAACLTAPVGAAPDPVERADLEDALWAWLDEHGVDPSHASALADGSVGPRALSELAEGLQASELDVAVRWIAAGRVARAVAADVERSAARVHELVEAIKAFTFMDQRAGPELVDVGQGLRDTLRILRAKATAQGTELSLSVEPGLPPAFGVGSELNQVWMNLVDNALDAVGGGGAVRVAAGRERDRLVVRVADDGPGIPGDVLPRIFDPFFTTKPPGQGTGLGLELTRRLVLQHGGEIDVLSEPGRTEFSVSLPLEGGDGW